MTRIYSRAYEDKVRQLPCQACGRQGDIQVHHGTGNRARGKRAGSGESAALCLPCHQRRHDKGAQTFAAAYGSDHDLIEKTRAEIARRFPAVEIPPRDPPQNPIPAPVFSTWRPS